MSDSSCYVLPDDAFHKRNPDNGLGTDIHFLRTMWKLLIKYRRDYKKIYSPCYITSTTYTKAIPRIMCTIIKNSLIKLNWKIG